MNSFLLITIKYNHDSENLTKNQSETKNVYLACKHIYIKSASYIIPSKLLYYCTIVIFVMRQNISADFMVFFVLSILSTTIKMFFKPFTFRMPCNTFMLLKLWFKLKIVFIYGNIQCLLRQSFQISMLNILLESMRYLCAELIRLVYNNM